MTFKEFRKDFQEAFSKLVKDPKNLYVVDISSDELWSAYIESFPEEEGIRQSFQCNACKSFIKYYGKIVTIDENLNLVSAWNFETGSEYQPAVDALKKAVESKRIFNIFVAPSRNLGVNHNVQVVPETGERITRYHFYGELPSTFKVTNEYDIPTQLSKYASQRGSLYRALNEISPNAISSVLELIAEKNLYRGEEFKELLKSFQTFQNEYLNTETSKMYNYCWKLIAKLGPETAISAIRGTAIGTLLTALSEEGAVLEKAVNSFETKVAGPNYKRPQAVVTQSMVKQAQEELSKLGLLTSLNRRHATTGDIPVEEVYYVNRNTVASTDIFDLMKENVTVNPSKVGRSIEIAFTDFHKNIIPTATSIEVLFENRHEGSTFNMTTAQDPKSPSLFKWGNPFSWSYVNSVTDSIKERVKAQGGNISAPVRVSLSWHNYDDLDLAVIEPNGNKIYFGDSVSDYSGGKLDVDMNAGGKKSREAVENIFWQNPERMLSGKYKVRVNNFAKRENIDVGYELQVELFGETYQYAKETSPSDGANHFPIEFEKTLSGEIKMLTSLSATTSSKPVWGLETNKWQKVSMILPSPNHWAGKDLGNKHVFLVLEGMNNPDDTRGIYNEYIDESINVHKRVFETLGSKTMIPTGPDQMAGLGFSTTRQASAILRVDGKLYNVKF